MTPHDKLALLSRLAPFVLAALAIGAIALGAWALS